MKKSLIALAVMAAAGAASAQSSVQVYGLIDAYFGSAKTTTLGVGLSQTGLESGGVNSSRWGLQGSEDLGGGLKAVFKLEQGFKADTGAVDRNGSGFTRQAYVGLAGGFGEVQVGKVWTAYDDVSGAHIAVFDSVLSATRGAFKSDGYEDNTSNGVRYTSPSFNGFTASVSHAFGENKTPALSASNITAYALQYANGPLSLAVARQNETARATGPAANVDTDYTRFGGSYDFGVAKLLANYGTVDLSNGDDVSEYQIGVDVPLSQSLVLSGNYASSKTENAAGNKVTDRDGFGVAVSYTLSKRTFVYGGFRRVAEDNAAGIEQSKASVYAVGVQHKF